MKSTFAFDTIHTNGRPPAENDTPPREPAPSLPAQTQPKRPRGFACMDRGYVRELASKGGKAAHAAGTGHEFTSDEARVAGRQGGRATHAKRRHALQQARETLEANSAGEKAG